MPVQAENTHPFDAQPIRIHHTKGLFVLTRCSSGGRDFFGQHTMTPTFRVRTEHDSNVKWNTAGWFAFQTKRGIMAT
jgi:hypothetical protein